MECVYSCIALFQNENTDRLIFSFHITALTMSRSSFSNNYIDYFRISGINEPRWSFSPLWSFFSPLQHNPSHMYTQKHSTPHGNDSLINPISSGCLPTQWCCQRRQVTEDAFRFVMKISPMCVKLCCRSWCYRITWSALKRNVTIVELIVIHCSEFTIKWP